MEIIILILYIFFISYVFFYSLVQIHLIYLFQRFKKQTIKPLESTADFIPPVTVQLPVYNELYVIERLLETVAAFDYPKECLQIQVLDDSTDETVARIAKKVKELQQTGLHITHVRREGREGFKAGALAYGLIRATGEFIAIFDADFLPQPDFLKKTIPYFQKAEIGVVQTCWEHINESYSLLTQLQAFGLDAHFSIEQHGRNFGNHFINFNGTAGVWRKTCIEEAGGWQADTLTEDLDLSYRAQLKGWKFKYLGAVGTPAELPVEMQALKTQQFRWTKGAAECARKNLGKVLWKRNIPLFTKLHALFHLMNSFLFVCVFMLALLSIPLLWVKSTFPQYQSFFRYSSVFLLCTLFLTYFYWVAYRQHQPGGIQQLPRFLAKFLLFLSFSTGLSLHNTLAVVEGYLGKKTPFIRTPKFNIQHQKDSWKGNKYLRRKLSVLTLLEGILALYFTYGIYLGIYWGDYGIVPFYLLWGFGFGAIFYYSLHHARK